MPIAPTRTIATERQKESEFSALPRQRVWKSATDPKSGRTYYYDVATRETQWRKPVELASDAERRAIDEKECKQREFFKSMEKNILKCLQNGHVPGTPLRAQKEDDFVESAVVALPQSMAKPGALSGGPRNNILPLERSSLIRTISTMDNDLIVKLMKMESSLPGSTNSPEHNVSKDANSSFLSSLPQPSSRAPFTATFRPNTKVLPTATPAPGVSSQMGRFFYPSMQDLVNEDEALEKIGHAADEMTRVSSTASQPTSVLLPTDGNDSDSTSPRGMTNLKKLVKPNMGKRNTCGTIYVGTTMAAPDKDATIKCVCGVFRAHMLQSAREDASLGPCIRFDEYDIFNDHPTERGNGSSCASFTTITSYNNKKSVCIPKFLVRGRAIPVVVEQFSNEATELGIEALSLESIESGVPSLDEIADFYRDIFRRSQMESDCIIMSLIYVERLIRVTNGGVRPRIGNWRSVLFSSMVMSSKVWDDLSMWNAEFSQTCPTGVKFSLKRVNELELAMLSVLKYNVKVLASEYAKYYFLLRSMLIKSGLAGEDLASPLDVEGAKKLEYVSANFQAVSAKREEVLMLSRRRSKSMGDMEGQIGQVVRIEENNRLVMSPRGSPKLNSARVTLEHVVKM